MECGIIARMQLIVIHVTCLEITGPLNGMTIAHAQGYQVLQMAVDEVLILYVTTSHISLPVNSGVVHDLKLIENGFKELLVFIA